MNHPASFAVRLNGAQGKMAAKVHSPSGALEECVVTELEKGRCAHQSVAARMPGTPHQHVRLPNLLVTKSLCPFLQTSTPSASSPERTASTPSMSNSTALTSREVLSKSESGNLDKRASLVWCRHMGQDWREARQVGSLSDLLTRDVFICGPLKRFGGSSGGQHCTQHALIWQVLSPSSSSTTRRQDPGPWP